MMMEKVLELDTESYTFEIVFWIGVLWHDDRVHYVPKATQEALNKCDRANLCAPLEGTRCTSEAPCALNLYGNPMSKCCDSLWNPLQRIENGLSFTNHMEIEILGTEGPSPVHPIPDSGPNGDAFMYGQRIRGKFYVPMSYADFPRDRQQLDIHMATLAGPSRVKFFTADGLYVLGGKFLHPDETERFAKDPTFEDVSGWNVLEKCEVFVRESNFNYLLWYHRDLVPKFDVILESEDAIADYYGYTDRDSLLEAITISFVTARVTVERRPAYFIENIVYPVILINAMNVMTFFLLPNTVELRLTSCGTMILALMAFQVVVADSLPATGYSTGPQVFLKISNSYMIVGAFHAIVCYYFQSHGEVFRQEGAE